MANNIRRITEMIWKGCCVIIILLGTKQANGDINCDVKSDQNETVTTLFVGDTVDLTFTVTCVNISSNVKVTIEQKDPNDFNLVFDELIFHHETVNESYEKTMNVTIKGTQLTISEFDVIATDDTNGDNDNDVVSRESLLTYYVKVNRVPNKVARIIRYLVTAGVVITVWLIGITTDAKIILQIIKRPYGVIIGLLCQFLIMPFTAWSLAKMLGIGGPAGVGLVLDGSCPGGTNSNFFSVLLDVDYVLSITMTFFSMLLALGMMPLNLFIYASSFTSAGEIIRTPFLDIVIQLAFLALPVSLGIFLGWRFPKVREITERYIKPVSLLVVTVLLATDLPFNLYIFVSPWQYYFAAVIFPVVGGTAGFLISKVARLTTKKAVTVAIETGIQNALIAVTVLGLSYPQPEADLATRLPYLILIFTTIEGILMTLVYALLKRYYWHGVPYDDEDDKTSMQVTKESDYNQEKKIGKEQHVSSGIIPISTVSEGVATGKYVSYDDDIIIGGGINYGYKAD